MISMNKWVRVVVRRLDGIDEIRCGGDDGRPCYVSGPDDDVEAILSHLESRFGPGGFTFTIMTDMTDL